MKRAILMSLIIAVPAGFHAALAQEAPTWTLLPSSRLEFDATQQGAVFTGTFEQFDATIRFDPASPGTSELRITVHTASVNTGFGERDRALREDDLLATGSWPTASFAAESVRRLARSRFEAVGSLTIRDTTRRVTLPFTFRRDAEGAELAGALTIARLAFGVGQGEWATTRWIGDEVVIRFRLRLREAAGSAAGLTGRSGGGRQIAGVAEFFRG